MKKRTLFIIPLLILMMVVIAGFLLSVDFLSSGNIQRQKENLESAIQKDITDFYAYNGYYPEDLSVLKDNYGLTYNEELFFVDYQIYGANLRPVVTVLERSTD